jgi:hypothetical protein
MLGEARTALASTRRANDALASSAPALRHDARSRASAIPLQAPVPTSQDWQRCQSIVHLNYFSVITIIQ